MEQVEHAGEQLSSIASLAADVEGRSMRSPRAPTPTVPSWTACSMPEQMRSDLTVSDQQTRQLADAAVQMEGQAEIISERLAEVGLGMIITSASTTWPVIKAPAALPRSSRPDVEQNRISLDGPVRPQLHADPEYPSEKYHTRFDGYTDQAGDSGALLPRHEGWSSL